MIYQLVELMSAELSKSSVAVPQSTLLVSRLVSAAAAETVGGVIDKQKLAGTGKRRPADSPSSSPGNVVRKIRNSKPRPEPKSLPAHLVPSKTAPKWYFGFY